MSIYQFVEHLRAIYPALDFTVAGRVTGLDLLLGGFVVVVGACFGSFLNVVIWRLPRGESIVRVPSHCPLCNYRIRPWDNIPILSWLILRGRCRQCRAPISPRYVAVEVLTAFIFLAVWLRAWHLHHVSPFEKAWPTPMLLAYVVLILALIAIAFIDLDLRTVPDQITFFGIGVAVIVALVWPASHELTTPPGDLEALNHKLLLKVFAGSLVGVYPAILDSPRLLALLDSVLGIIFGGGILWLLSEFGKLVRGRKTIRLKEPATVELRRDGYETPRDGFEKWDDTFIRAKDALIIRGQVTEFTLRNKASAEPPSDLTAVTELRVTEKGVQWQDRLIPLDDLKSVKIGTRELLLLREEDILAVID